MTKIRVHTVQTEDSIFLCINAHPNIQKVKIEDCLCPLITMHQRKDQCDTKTIWQQETLINKEHGLVGYVDANTSCENQQMKAQQFNQALLCLWHSHCIGSPSKDALQYPLSLPMLLSSLESIHTKQELKYHQQHHHEPNPTRWPTSKTPHYKISIGNGFTYVRMNMI